MSPASSPEGFPSAFFLSHPIHWEWDLLYSYDSSSQVFSDNSEIYNICPNVFQIHISACVLTIVPEYSTNTSDLLNTSQRASLSVFPTTVRDATDHHSSQNTRKQPQISLLPSSIHPVILQYILNLPSFLTYGLIDEH